jgi:hypothetical protein
MAQDGRYIFIRDNGKVAFTTNSLRLMHAARVNATHMQDRETGAMYDVAHSGPLSHRLSLRTRTRAS